MHKTNFLQKTRLHHSNAQTPSKVSGGIEIRNNNFDNDFGLNQKSMFTTSMMTSNYASQAFASKIFKEDNNPEVKMIT